MSFSDILCYFLKLWTDIFSLCHTHKNYKNEKQIYYNLYQSFSVNSCSNLLKLLLIIVSYCFNHIRTNQKILFWTTFYAATFNDVQRYQKFSINLISHDKWRKIYCFSPLCSNRPQVQTEELVISIEWFYLWFLWNWKDSETNNLASFRCLYICIGFYQNCKKHFVYILRIFSKESVKTMHFPSRTEVIPRPILILPLILSLKENWNVYWLSPFYNVFAIFHVPISDSSVFIMLN